MMGRKKEVMNALDDLGIDYNELDSGEVLFNHGEGKFWFHPDDSNPDFVTVNKMEKCDHASVMGTPRLCRVVNEVNKGAPGIKAVIMDEDVLLNCDLYSGSHRLNVSDLKGVLTRLETAGKVFKKLLDVLPED